MAVKIAAGADHAGFALKQVLVERLRAAGHEVVDLGTTSAESVDYPVFAHAVAAKVADRRGRARVAGVWHRPRHVHGRQPSRGRAGRRLRDGRDGRHGAPPQRLQPAVSRRPAARRRPGLGRILRRGWRPPSRAPATSAAWPRSTTLRPRPNAEPPAPPGSAGATPGDPPPRPRPRPSWDTYFLQLARQAATRSTCLRRQVGAVLVRDRRILATGYNGAPRGVAHCLDIGCLRDQMKIPSG